MTILKSTVEKKAEAAESLDLCHGIKVSYIREKVAEILSFIGTNNIFSEYTKHDITHVDEMFNIIDWLIPNKTKECMTLAEWLMLLLAVYFHDMGMVVTKKEFQNRENSSFKQYRISIEDNEENADYLVKLCDIKERDEFLYQEYVRENHAKRIKNWINNNSSEYGDAAEVIKEINEILLHLDKMFLRDLSIVCESHHYENIDDLNIFKTDAKYGNGEQEKVNMHYIAVILRIADLLHITKDRTPSLPYRFINPNNPISLLEWQKQMAVKAVAPMDKLNEEGCVDKSLEPDTIEIIAYFDKPDLAEAFFGLSSYIKYSRGEIKKCYNSVRNVAKQKATNDYIFPWKEINEEKIETYGFEPKQLQFTLDQDNILQLLIGHTLYNDSSVVLREIIQNGIDAIKLQNTIEPSNTKIGKVSIEWDSVKRELSFWDNGTGMSNHEIENFLLRVGSSRYRSKEFLKKYPNFSAISRFGIGILTCFMIADDIDILTNSPDEEEANKITIRKVDGRYLLKKVSKNELPVYIKHHGTCVKLFIRSTVDMKNIISDIQKWILIPYCPVCLNINGIIHNIGYESPKKAIEEYAKQCGINVNEKEYRIDEDVVNGVHIAYLLRYNSYQNEWYYCSLRSIHVDGVYIPMGTCIEGIRVEENTPGYQSRNILALADVRNSTYQTNVARSLVEWEGNNKELLRAIYELYVRHIIKQLETLKEKGYSMAWIASESDYLLDSLIPSAYTSPRTYADDETRPINIELLTNEINKIKCIIIEKDEKRVVYSPIEVNDLIEFTIIDSKMMKSAEELLREVTSNVTMFNIVQTIQGDVGLLKGKNILCNFNDLSILHLNSLHNKQISSIIVDKKQRRIDLNFTNGSDIWETFYLNGNFGRFDTLYIPMVNIPFDGLDEEIGIKSTNGIYLRFESDLTNYVNSLKENFDYKNSREDNRMLKTVLSFVFDSNALSMVISDDTVNKEQIFNNVFDYSMNRRKRNDSYMDIWKRINKEELMNIIFKDQYTLYSTSDWYRQINNEEF